MKPIVTFKHGFASEREQFDRFMEQAHRGCFIANSVASCVNVTINAEMEIV